MHANTPFSVFYTHAACTAGLRNLTFHGENDAKGEDSSEAAIKSGCFQPIADALFPSSGLQPSLVPRVRELLLHHRDVLQGQLQLQVLQDSGSGSAEYGNQWCPAALTLPLKPEGIPVL